MNKIFYKRWKILILVKQMVYFMSFHWFFVIPRESWFQIHRWELPALYRKYPQENQHLNVPCPLGRVWEMESSM